MSSASADGTQHGRPVVLLQRVWGWGRGLGANGSGG